MLYKTMQMSSTFLVTFPCLLGAKLLPRDQGRALGLLPTGGAGVGQLGAFAFGGPGACGFLQESK